MNEELCIELILNTIREFIKNYGFLQKLPLRKIYLAFGKKSKELVINKMKYFFPKTYDEAYEGKLLSYYIFLIDE